jgi:DNA-binding transcriptional LysR family regulator
MSPRFRQVAALWNYLPAFRAVAETQHLPTAGEMMGLTPPALSRSVQQLEEALGTPLFHRRGRNLVLNDDGAVFLEAVRSAMRNVHNAVEHVQEKGPGGVFSWAAPWFISEPIIHSLSRLIEEYPRIIPRMVGLDDGDVIERLKRGQLDFVVTTQEIVSNGIQTVELAQISQAVYCSLSHPLAKEPCGEVAWSTLADYPFAAPEPISGVIPDGWPQSRKRRIAMYFSRMESGYQACKAGHLIAVLPENVGEGLFKLRSLENPRSIFALFRESSTVSTSFLLTQMLTKHLS